MAMLQRKVGQARSRLVFNLFLEHAAWVIPIVAGAWAIFWTAERVFQFGAPFFVSVGVAAGAALLAAVAWTLFRGVRPLTAAVELDRAAGLKERLSTGLALRGSGDEFARATVADAERVAAKVLVPPNIPVRVPRAWPLSTLLLVVAFCIGAFLPPLNLFASTVKETEEQRIAVERERQALNVALTAQVQKMQEFASKNADLKDLVKDAESIRIPESPGQTPEDIRREAVKQIDKLAEKIQQQKNADQEDVIKQLKRMLSQIDPQQSPTPNDKLAQSLAAGDFSGAKQALEEMKAALEKAAKSDDPEEKKAAAEVQKRIDAMAKQLAEAAKSQQIRKELENKAGLSEEQAKELVKQLSKMDAKQIQKELQKKLSEKGVSQEQIEKLAQKIANNQQAMKAAQKMADAMQKASQCMKEGQQGQQGQQGQKNSSQNGEAEAAQALAEAAEQLSEMEMSEQQLNDLEAKLSELDEMKSGICEGNCPNPGKDGDSQGAGKPVQGWGDRDKQRMAHQMKNEKAKSKLSGGKIIGQMLVSGEQVKGEATAEIQEAVTAAVRDATDAVNRDEVPRQYERTLRNYFDRLAGLAGENPKAATGADKSEKSPRP